MRNLNLSKAKFLQGGHIATDIRITIQTKGKRLTARRVYCYCPRYASFNGGRLKLSGVASFTSSLLCSSFGLGVLSGLKRKDFTSVDYTRVISYGYNSFSIWSFDIIVSAFSRSLHVKTTTPSHVHTAGANCSRLFIWTSFHAFKVDFLHGFQLLGISKTVTRASRTLTYLVLRLDIPFRVF